MDAVSAAPDLMRGVGERGGVVGPRGLMPNPKTGTVTFEVGKAVDDIKAGKLDFRVDKNGVVHAAVGKISFDETQLGENVRALFAALMRVKPASAKGKYVEGVFLTWTMGPSVRVEPGDVEMAQV